MSRSGSFRPGPSAIKRSFCAIPLWKVGSPIRNDEQIRVIEYDPALARRFADLNYEWIAKYYTVEAHDREQLDHPELIVEAGGQIFFAMVGREAAGTVAMITMAGNDLELAKMAVAPAFQGRKLGDILMRACIDFARDMHADGIVLESNTKQVAAINLYRKFGFNETPLDPDSQFARANIRMRLEL